MSTPAPGLREQRKARTRKAIQEHALRLFLADGYDATTVERIASAAGVSHMTFFRYFPSKEAVVENDEYDPLLIGFIRAQPPELGPLTALRNAVVTGMREVYDTDKDALLVRTRLVLTTPALRGRQWRNGDSTQQLFAEALATRTGGEITFDLRVLAAAVLGALSTALTVWVEGDGAEDLPTLMERGFDALGRLDA
ncbi:TetR family transcriptional regulator [Umezawaea sp. Da 62-37]|uniref:acyl-CoA-like ligand-binding transcription factor n=1 Tax=Umezawaea sp. Da 62-37 TaxID=3075927 RepID=UPI0028F6E875|nr:TetR family transcriptional regulator [Umezawaea sp. Da 62-37]WNV84461.1 TetR family transcriptional regulator [Umezawaea sp. Da 62-37]